MIKHARAVQEVRYLEIDGGMGLALRECRPVEFVARMEGHGGEPCAWVLRESDWLALAPQCPAVEDCGTKHKAKGLNAYLPGRQRVPVIRASYESAGRCLQGIEALLKNGAQAPGARLFVIVVATDIFDDLSRRAEAAPGAMRRKAVAAGLAADPIELILAHLGRVPPEHPSRSKLIGGSAKLELARTMAAKAALSDIPVLILGDSGTGKELTAQLIHNCGNRQKPGRFLAVNCAAIPDDLLESELFGSVSGAFTGARNKHGLWELAKGGTLFLDEIGDLALRHQAKILRALEEGVIRKVGDDRDIPVNARIITATHRDIESSVRGDKFRKDLYYRLYGIRILLPSLDECPADIACLAAHFWKEITGCSSARLSHAVCSMLESMSWPGNGRQLKALLRRVRQLFDTDEPKVEHLRLLGLHEGLAMQAEVSRQAASGRAVQMECLAHLRRTAAALHSVELALRRKDRQRARSGPAPALAEMQWVNLRMSVGEIRSLCREPLLFNSEPLFRKVEALLDALDAIDGANQAPLGLEGLDDHSGADSDTPSTQDLLDRIQSAMQDVFAVTRALLADI